MNNVAMSTTNISFYGVKGGQGATVTAARVAVELAGMGRRVLFVSDDAATVYGLAEPPFGEFGEVNDNIQTLSQDYFSQLAEPDEMLQGIGVDTVVFDYKVPYAFQVLVTKACYMALRAAVVKNEKPDLCVSLIEDGRALSSRDIERALGVTTIETVYDKVVARKVDAGLLAYNPQADERIKNIIRQLPLPLTAEQVG